MAAIMIVDRKCSIRKYNSKMFHKFKFLIKNKGFHLKIKLYFSGKIGSKSRR